MGEETLRQSGGTPANLRKIELLRQYVRPVETAPILTNKFKTRLIYYGFHDYHHDPDLEPQFFGIYGAEFVVVPVSFETVYLISHPLRENGRPDNRSYLFHGQLTPEEFNKIYPGVFAKKKKETLIIAAIVIPLCLAVIAFLGWYFNTRGIQ